MKEQPKPDDQFARQLEEIHDAMSGRDASAASESQTDEALGERLQSARRVLGLIERVCRENDEVDQETLVDAATPVDLQGVAEQGAQPRVGIDDQRIGRFEIVRQLGQGGYGLVFLAVDPKLDRQVALKIQRPEATLSAEMRSRFLREAKAAAALSHPNIVPVYEAGNVGPVIYIASQYVDGLTLAQWLNQQPDSRTDERSAALLVSTLAEAVQHAHQRGVLHRDLKPGNVLLDKKGSDKKGSGTFFRNGPESASHKRCLTPFSSAPLITDFGLAKLVDEPTSDTHSGSVIGTPSYMAPEQTRGNQSELGPAADIYALGAILYELLTGRPPFASDNIVDTIQQVQKAEPVPPRRYDPRISRDLQAVCLKCLEKSPNDRYSSAHDLQTDLQRFLDGFAVSAQPISQIKRLSKWSRRNPVLSASLAVSALLLTAALSATTWGLVSTSAALKRESVARSSESKAKVQARQQFLKLKDAVDTYFTKVSDDPSLKSMPGAEALRQELLGLALGYYQEFVSTNREDPDLQSDLAMTYFRIGEILRELGVPSEAQENYLIANGMVDGQLRDEPANRDLREMKATLLQRLAAGHESTGGHAKALELSTEAIRLQQIIRDEYPDDWGLVRSLAKFENHHALILLKRDQKQAAREHLLMASSLYASQPPDLMTDGLLLEMADNQGQLSNVLRDLGEMPEAERLAEETVLAFKEIAESDPVFWEAHDKYVGAVLQRSSFHLMRGEVAEVQTLAGNVLPVINRLCQLHPRVKKYLSKRAGVINRLTFCASQSRDMDTALELSTELVDIQREIMEIDPTVVTAKRDLAGNLMNAVGFRIRGQQDLDAVPQILAESLQLWLEVSEAEPDYLPNRLGLANVYQVWAGVDMDDRNWEQALQHSDQCLGLLEPLRTNNPSNPQLRMSLWHAYGFRASARSELGQLAGAAEDREQAVGFAPPPARDESLLDSAIAHLKADQYDSALATLGEVSDIQTLGGKELYLRARFFGLLRDHGDPSLQQENFELAIDSLLKAHAKGYFRNPRRLEDLKNDPSLTHLLNDERTKDLIQ